MPPQADGPARRLSALLLVLALAPSPTLAVPDDPVALWQQSLAVQRFPDLRADATLTTKFPGGDEVTLQVTLAAMLRVDGASRMAITRVVAGGPLQGSAFLNVEQPRAPDQLWAYLPAVGTPRRLVSSNLGDSYLGSEFRYGDLVQPDPEEYAVVLRGDDVVAGEPCLVLEARPRDERLARDTGLGRQVIWLRRSNLVERKIEQYDRQDTLTKVLEVPRLFVDATSGKVFPLERRIRNVRSGAESAVVFTNVRVNQGMSADSFSPVHLADRG